MKTRLIRVSFWALLPLAVVVTALPAQRAIAGHGSGTCVLPDGRNVPCSHSAPPPPPPVVTDPGGITTSVPQRRYDPRTRGWIDNGMRDVRAIIRNKSYSLALGHLSSVQDHCRRMGADAPAVCNTLDDLEGEIVRKLKASQAANRRKRQLDEAKQVVGGMLNNLADEWGTSGSSDASGGLIFMTPGANPIKTAPTSEKSLEALLESQTPQLGKLSGPFAPGKSGRPPKLKPLPEPITAKEGGAKGQAKAAATGKDGVLSAFEAGRVFDRGDIKFPKAKVGRIAGGGRDKLLRAVQEVVRNNPNWKALDGRENAYKAQQQKVEKKIKGIEKEMEAGEGDKGTLQVELVKARDEEDFLQSQINDLKRRKKEVEKESYTLLLEEKPEKKRKEKEGFVIREPPPGKGKK